LGGEYNLDPARIYVNGLSNGGGMSFVLSGKLSQRIAAFGSVAGAYAFAWSEYCPARAVPAIIFHGTADPIVPYHGGVSGSTGFSLPSIPEWVSTLARKNGCLEAPVSLPPVGKVEGIRFANCASGADVVFYTVHEGGHSWPGGGSLPKFIVGNTNRDIDATKIMWDFFCQHPLLQNK
jgi:polyhydroxybutyrate depolymerase